MDIKQIVEGYLKDHGYDGLFINEDDGERYCCCAITWDGGLMHCGEPSEDCCAGYLDKEQDLIVSERSAEEVDDGKPESEE